MVWGMDFGIVSAIFSGTDMATKFVLELITFLSSGDRAKQQQQQQQPQTSTTVKQQQQTAWLWSVVLRNVLLAVYFGRHGGAIKMARSSVLYGALTYYFVSQKQKRDTDAMAAMMFSNRTVGRGNHPSSVSSSSSAALLQELLSYQFAKRSSGTMSTPSPTGSTPATNMPFVGRSASSGYQSSSSTTATTKKNINSSSPPDNVLDVEFEKVDDNDEANPK
jgi:uncharacterized membrane protein YgcG